MTQFEIYSEKILLAWDNEFTLIKYQPGNKELKRKTRLIIADLNNLQYSVDPNHFIVRHKKPEASTCLNKNQWFINKANIIHSELYDYSKSEYINSHTKTLIKCASHGDFYMTPNNHLSGAGCPICSKERLTFNNTKTKEDFITKSNLIHTNKYIYDKFIYTTCHKKSIIICKEHGEFEQTPINHRVSGCPICGNDNLKGGYAAIAKYYPDTIVNLYLLELTGNNEIFYKIGLTKNIKTRVNKIPYKKNILKEIKGTISFLFELEQQIIKEMKNNKYMPKKFFSGKNECFKINKKELTKLINQL
jgi:hypothetical protein